jgi:hypothetical protein
LFPSNGVFGINPHARLTLTGQFQYQPGIPIWELLRFHSKLEKSSDEVEDVKYDRPIGPASERSNIWPRI